jgi:hypothetical protein
MCTVIPSNPSREIQLDSFLVQHYWRVVWAVPAAMAILQSLLMICIFQYDTPLALKRTGNLQALTCLMKQMYSKE